MSKLNDILKELRGEIGGDVLILSICGLDGVSIARESTLNDADSADQQAGRAVMALQAGKRVAEKLKLGTFEESLMTTNQVYVMTNFLGDGSYALIAVLTKKATPGTARMLIEEYSPRIWDVIPR